MRHLLPAAHMTAPSQGHALADASQLPARLTAINQPADLRPPVNQAIISKQVATHARRVCLFKPARLLFAHAAKAAHIWGETMPTMQTHAKNTSRWFLDHWYLLFICLVLVMRVFFWFSPSHAEKINMIYLWPMAITATSLVVVQRRMLLSFRFALPGAMALWLFVSCVVNGDPYLVYNRTFMLGIILSFLSFFLVTPTLPPEKRENVFRWLASLYCLLMVGMASLGLYVALTGQSIRTPLSDEAIRISINRLFFLHYHPNEAGSALVIALYLLLYLFASWRGVAKRLLLALAGLVTALAIALTGSRTSVLLAALGVGVLVFWAIYTHLFGKRKWLRWPVGLVALAGVTAALYLALSFSVGFVATLAQHSAAQVPPPAVTEGQPAEPAPQAATPPQNVVRMDDSRVQMQDIGTFNMRVEIWQTGLDYMKAHPRAYLFGVPDNIVARIPQAAGRQEMHMHNAYLEMFLLGGVPGIALYALFLLLLAYSGLTLAFRRTSGLGTRFLAFVPLLIAVNGITEIYPLFSGNVMDMMYFAISGTVLSLAGNSLPRIRR